VAAINGYPAHDLPWQAHAYLRRARSISPSNLIQLAMWAVNRIAAPNSELPEVYRDSSPETEADWRASVVDLAGRLSSPIRAAPRLTFAMRMRVMRTEAVERLLRRLLHGRLP
jgi:hypothetical protein